MDYEKAWASFKEDLKDLKHYRSKMSNDFESDQILGIVNNLLYQMETYEQILGYKPRKTNFGMKGWDYSEIMNKFGIEDYDPPPEDDPYYQHVGIETVFRKRRVQAFLEENHNNPEVIEIVRDYLQTISCVDGYYGKVWKAVSEIEDDFVFMQFVFALLYHMWT